MTIQPDPMYKSRKSLRRWYTAVWGKIPGNFMSRPYVNVSKVHMNQINQGTKRIFRFVEVAV